MGADSGYWDLAGPEMPEQWDEIVRVSQCAALFQDKASLGEEEAKELAEALVVNAAQSEADTAALDTILHHLLEPDTSNVDKVLFDAAVQDFVKLMADTFYSKNAMEIPSLGIRPSEPRVYKEALTWYLRAAWWLGVEAGINEQRRQGA